MPINVRLVKAFLEKAITANSEDGILATDVLTLYNAWTGHRGSSEKIQPSVFYPITELYCRMKSENSNNVCGFDSKTKRIRGFSFSTDDLRRLTSIFVNGTGASAENQEIVNTLMAPLNDIVIPL